MKIKLSATEKKNPARDARKARRAEMKSMSVPVERKALRIVRRFNGSH